MGVLRSLWIVVPLALTVVTAVLTIIVYCQQLTSSGFLRNLNFISIALPAAGLNAPITLNGASTSLSAILTGGDIQSQYDISIWNYCTPKNCTTPEAGFYFNPLTVWNLQTSMIQGLLPSDWKDSLAVYRAVSKWLFAAYTVAAVMSAVSILMGIASIWGSRLSACCVGLATSITAVFAIAASATAMALFGTVKGFIDLKLGKYGVSTTVNMHTVGLSWAGAGFAVAAALAWALAMCCSGKKKAHRGSDYDKLVYPAAPAYHGAPQGGYNMRQMHTGYEPVSRV